MRPRTARWPAHLPEYALEAALLGIFLFVACALGVLLEHPEGAARAAIPAPLARRALFGAGMAATALALVYSPWGKRSGAHLNPAVTLTFLRLGRVAARDAAGYVAGQSAGAILGVLAAWAVLGAPLAHADVSFVVTRPGPAGAAVAFASEAAISFLLMSAVLLVSSSRHARLGGAAAALLIFLFITFEAPLSGMSMNPARSLGSALAARDLGALWIYFTAPPLGMLAAASLLGARVRGCAKLDHAPDVACIFCGQPGAPATRREPPAIADGAAGGAALGIAAWAAFQAVLLPLAEGRGPKWTPAEMRALLPALVVWVVAGAVLGAAGAFGARVQTRRPIPAPAPEPVRRRVVILGGGFAGVGVARELERLLGPDRTVEVALVSETNALLFTPMLAEVAGSSLEPTHVSTPIRTTLRRTEVIRGRAARVDLDARRVELVAEPDGPTLPLPFDHLVLALGAVTNWFGNEALERNAIGFKSLAEAIRIRNRVIDAFERAARERDGERRRGLLSFVVAGGGFAGVELAGALNDFARGILADYPSIAPEDVRVILVHAGDRILPELPAGLGAYARAAMEARGVVFRLGSRVKDARPGAAVLDGGEVIPTHTVVWTAGARPHPLLAALPVAHDRRGAVVVDPALAVPGVARVWAAGDCAAVPAPGGGTCPPTAQCAIREARRLARNVHAALTGHAPRPFRFESLGALCVVGHQTACAELRVPFTRGRVVRFSGLLAWILWRAIYLAKLPGLERKVRVCTDWLVELFFPRDIVQTIDLGGSFEMGRPAAPPSDEVKHAS